MSKTKKVTMEISKNEETDPKIDQAKSDAARKAYKEFIESLEDKVYLVNGKADHLLSFLSDDAEWTSHEALGVIRAHEDIESARKKNNKKLFLSGLAIEAIAYYASKKTGKGLEQATEFAENIFIPINEAMSNINDDRKQAEQLQLEWASAAQGIELEKE